VRIGARERVRRAFPDSLAPARGVLYGVAFGSVLWVLLGAVVLLVVGL
jgi:hypothetical protein